MRWPSRFDTLLVAVDPRGKNPFERERAGGPEGAALPQLVESFAQVVLPETTALLAAIAQLGTDELTRTRARLAVATRPHPLPDWLAGLGEASVYRAVESTHVLGDGDSVLLGSRLLGHELTTVIYIDHNLGTVVKDAFPAPGQIGEVAGRMREAADDPDMTFRDIGLADARARVAEAIEVGAIMFPPFETETWPASRPLTEWLLRLLPEGGTGYVRPAWSGVAKTKLVKRFFASEFGKPLDDADHRDLLDQFLWFGTRLRAGRPAAVEPGRGRDPAGRLDPAQDRRELGILERGASAAARVHPVLPCGAQDPPGADRSDTRRWRTRSSPGTGFPPTSATESGT